MNHRAIAGVALAIAVSLAITGCGGGTASSPAPVDGGGSAVEGGSTVEGGGTALSNPVDLLKKIDGCHIPAGTEVGDTDIDGNRYASCNLKDNAGTDGTDVTARTFPGDPTQLATADELSADDSHKIIVGSDFIVTITGDWSSYSRHVDPAEIAAQLGGTVQPAS